MDCLMAKRNRLRTFNIFAGAGVFKFGERSELVEVVLAEVFDVLLRLELI